MPKKKLTRKSLASQIQERIEQGEWSIGAPLPTSMQFAREYGVSLSTVFNAMYILKDRGFVTGVQGGRRYVAEWR